jgi:hypothetical protein
MGHRTRVGRVREVEMYGAKMLRVDLPTGEDLDGEKADFITEYYGGSSIYAVTPVEADIVRDYVRRMGDPRPARPISYRLEDRSGDDDDPDDGIDDDGHLL